MKVVHKLDLEDVLARPRVEACGDVAQTKDLLAVSDKGSLGRCHLQHLAGPARFTKGHGFGELEKNVDGPAVGVRQKQSSRPFAPSYIKDEIKLNRSKRSGLP